MNKLTKENIYSVLMSVAFDALNELNMSDNQKREMFLDLLIKESMRYRLMPEALLTELTEDALEIVDCLVEKQTMIINP